MDTAHPYYLNREPLSGDHGAVAERLSGLINRLIDYGTHSLCELLDHHSDRSGLVIRSLAAHVLDYVDGVSILLRKGACEPCQPLIRSAMEAMLFVRFMVQKDTASRAMAYAVAAATDHIWSLELFDPKTVHGQQYADAISKERGTHNAIDSVPAVATVTGFLELPEAKPIYEDWKKIKGKNKAARWFALAGASSLRQVAAEVGWESWYHMGYRILSMDLHADACLSRLHVLKDGTVRDQPIRYSIKMTQIGLFSATVLMAMYAPLLSHYFPAKMDDYSRWVAENIEAEFKALAEIEQDQPERMHYDPSTETFG